MVVEGGDQGRVEKNRTAESKCFFHCVTGRNLTINFWSVLANNADCSDALGANNNNW